MKKNNWIPFLSGVCCTLLAVSLMVPATAAAISKKISVNSGVKLYVDDTSLVPRDAAGNQVDCFIYNGTTYLPARAISQAFGKNISYDGKTNSVFIGQHKNGKPSKPLYKLDHFSSHGVSTYEIWHGSATDNLGTSHDSIIYPGYHSYQDSLSYVSYKLNGAYSSLAGTFFLPARYKDFDETYQVTFYGDDKILWSGSETGGSEPQKFSLDLTGVQLLRIEFSTNSEFQYFYLGDTMLYT